jgi:hypothetical protein
MLSGRNAVLTKDDRWETEAWQVVIWSNPTGERSIIPTPAMNKPQLTCDSVKRTANMPVQTQDT